MGIEIKCFATLSRFLPENSDDHPIQAGDTVESILDRLGIPTKEVNLIFVNANRAFLHTELKDGDRLGLFPAVGGG
ncbi:MoaD/ThiS family protein [Pseudodesulfovibrio tunisiensis]|uniref:MoaD/ThiS family protein n=1 Tax=Pseudodesulfovibrio tunisiensis TaxID=463192 RepID=UPI001FB419B9|nr:MoaD/ThiS family protein [Pseudodesulfovibrio tunisiensis]